jgi:hypothetical protein
MASNGGSLAVPAEIRAHVEQVRAHRAQMADAVFAVDDALGHPLQVPHWRERVLAAMAELAHDFRHHRALTEGENGWYAGILGSAPHLAGSVERLTAEHIEVSACVARFLAVLEADGPIPDPVAFREDVTALMGRLVRHRQLGSDLVYAAYEWDIGGSG